MVEEVMKLEVREGVELEEVRKGGVVEVREGS